MNKMGYKAYSDSYLMSLTKAQVIELLRVAEHNFFATEEALNNSAKAGMEIAEKYDKAKRLLKAAVEDMTGMQFGEECKVCSKKLLPNECPIHNNVSCILEKDFKWRYEDEALALIGEEGEQNDRT